MQLTYTLTLADYKAALRLHRRQKLTRRASFLFWYVAIPVSSIIALIAAVVLSTTAQTEWFARCLATGVGLLWLSIIMPFLRMITIRQGFRRIFPATATDRTGTIDINDDRIISGMPGISEGKFFWPGILAFAQDEKITLLYIDKNRFLLFPTYLLSPGQRSELSAMVDKHLVRKMP
jgi:hypothetical protein